MTKSRIRTGKTSLPGRVHRLAQRASPEYFGLPDECAVRPNVLYRSVEDDLLTDLGITSPSGVKASCRIRLRCRGAPSAFQMVGPGGRCELEARRARYPCHSTRMAQLSLPLLAADPQLAHSTDCRKVHWHGLREITAMIYRPRE